MFGNFVTDCVRGNLRGMQIQNFSEGHAPNTPLVGMHVFRTLLSTCYHPVSPLLKILYETLRAGVGFGSGTKTSHCVGCVSANTGLH